MFFSLLLSANEAWKTAGLQHYTMADTELDRRSDCGSIAFDFLLADLQVVCLKEMIVDDDPTWNYVVKAGIHEVFHLPSVPITVR